MSAARLVVTDYAGEPLDVGDLINYASRYGNRVRVADAVIIGIRREHIAGRLMPMLRVQPTGTDSGYGMAERRTLRAEWISPEHARLLTKGFAL